MAWNWTTYKSWTTAEGIIVKVVASAGLIGSLSLLWTDRDDPLYPTAKDSAEIMGALVERRLTHEDIVVITNLYPTFDVTNWSYETATNAVGLYPSRHFYMTNLPSEVALLSADFLDLWGTNELSSGHNMTEGRLEDDYYIVPYAMKEVMNLAWWRTNIWGDAAAFGDFEYLHTNQLYMTTNILHQAAKPLSAMRWTKVYGSDYTGLVTNTEPVDYVTWTTMVGPRDEADGWLPVLAELIVIHTNEIRRATPDYGSADLDAISHLPVYEHIGYMAWSMAGTNSYGVIIEAAQFKARNVWEPPVQDLIASVYDHGLFLEETTYSTLGTNCFYHPWYTYPRVWYATNVQTVVHGGRDVYPSTIYQWDGNFSALALNWFGNQLLDVMGDPYYGTLIFGWRAGDYYCKGTMIVDWQFQCLTNPAAIWKTDFGIR